MHAADVIAEVEILAGGPFRAVAQARGFIKGKAPQVFELEGYNSYNWDVVHRGFQTGSRFILFLSRTERPDVLVPLTPAAPRLSIQPDGVLLTLGDPPFRVPVRKSVMEDALALLVEFSASGTPPDRAGAFLRGLWEAGDIEPRYLAVALAGALRDPRQTDVLIEASKAKLLKLRLTAVEALGKVGSSQALAALRALLKDEKAIVAREAARMLVSRRDAESLPDLLAWVRRNAESLPRTADRNPDANKARLEAMALDILKFAGEAGPLLDADVIARPLLALARCPGESVAREALQAAGGLAQPAQIPALLELAEDRLYDWRLSATLALQRVTLAPFRDTDEFRTWWTQNGKSFGEDSKRDLVEACVKLLARADESSARRAVADLVRLAPGEIALVSAAPLLLKNESTVFTAGDLAAWNSAFAAPFLLERLGRDNLGERRDALDGLVRLCAVNPRLKEALWPLLRAVLTLEDGGCRRAAQTACGRLGQADGLDALLDAVQYAGGYEAQEAGKALYTLSARTLGFSIHEPIPDENAARRRLRGWWESAKPSFRPLAPGLLLPVREGAGGGLPRVWADVEPAARAARLDVLVLGDDSRCSAAAFALAWAERGPGDPCWRKLLAHGRQRNRAYGILGLCGGDAAPAAALGGVLAPAGAEAQPALCRALALLALAALRGEAGARPGAARIVDWLRSAGAKEDLAWRRLALVCLGLADGDAASLGQLRAVVSAALAAQPAEYDLFTTSAPSDDYALLAPALLALCARSDAGPLLAQIAGESTDRRTRETAARALSVRRAPDGVPALAKALEKAGRYDWQDLCRTLEPLLKPSDAPLLNALLDRADSAPRSAAAYLFALCPEVGNDADTRGHLITGLSDTSNIVRYYCASALGKRRSVAAVKKLVELLRDDDEDVRGAAAEALGAIGDAEACKAAAEASELQTRLDARWLRAMAIAGAERHTALLLKLVQSTAYADQRAGYEALGFCRQPVALQMLLKTFRNDEAMFQTIAGDALAQHGQAAFAALAEDLKATDRNTRARAVHLLSRLDLPASRAALEGLRNGEDPALRALVEFALKRLAATPGGAADKDADAGK